LRKRIVVKRMIYFFEEIIVEKNNCIFLISREKE
jgi:hypothetical protein